MLRRAFTLLEILVVVGIIAILIAMGAVSYSSAQKKARDAKRKSDLKSIQNAMEQYYANCTSLYPTGIPAVGTAFTTGASCANPNVTLMNYFPTDPLGGSYQCLSGSCISTGYTICPPDLGSGNYLETDNGSCKSTNTTCCVNNEQ